MTKGDTEAFVGGLSAFLGFAQLPVACWNLLAGDFAGAALNCVIAALALFIARRANRESKLARRLSETFGDADRSAEISEGKDGT